MNDPDILKLVKEQEDYLIKMRRYFHMNPELSNKEFETRKTIISELEKMGVEYRLAAGTGLVAIIKGGKPGKHHLLRCDMDALPVKEDTDNIYDDAADELVTGTLVSDRSGWTAIVPDGADAQAMFTESDDYWSGRASAAGEELPVIINFGKSYTFDGISASYLYYGYYTYASWTKSSKIEISGDGTTWEEVGILSNTNIIQVFYAPVTAQYLRITVPAPSSSWSSASFSCGNFNIYAK